jgi:hypothetical protein
VDARNPSLFPFPYRKEGDPSALAIHRFFNRIAWRDHPWLLPRLWLIAQQVTWPLRAAVLAVGSSFRYARATAQRGGPGPLRQVWQQWALALRHGIPPRAYYIFRLYQPAEQRRAEAWIHRFEVKSLGHERDGVYRVLNAAQGLPATRINNKLLLAREGRALGFATAPTLAAIFEGRNLETASGELVLPACDLIVKPAYGAGGQRVLRWDYVGEGRYRRAPRGRELAGEKLLRRLRRRSAGRILLVQPRLRNHPAIADLGGGALTTVRMQTALDERGVPELVAASYRVPVHDAVVDNIHRGGLACAVDLESGELGPGVTLAGDSDWLDRHPVSGAPLRGRRLPLWREARDLVCRAHAYHREVVFVGWDVGLTPEGPVVVEANVQADVNLLQRPLGAPLGPTRFGVLMAHHVARIGRLPASERRLHRRLPPSAAAGAPELPAAP